MRSVLLQDWQSLSRVFVSHTILYPFQHLQTVFSSNYLLLKRSLCLLLPIRLLRSAIFSFAECSAQQCTSSIHTEKLYTVQRFDWHMFMDALCFIRCVQENTTSFSSLLWIHKPRKKILAVHCLMGKVHYFENSCLLEVGAAGHMATCLILCQSREMLERSPDRERNVQNCRQWLQLTTHLIRLSHGLSFF